MKSLIALLLTWFFVFSASAKDNSEFIFFGYLGNEDTDIDYTKFAVICEIASPNSLTKCETAVTEPGYFFLKCPEFLNRNISCYVSNPVMNKVYPIVFDIGEFGTSQIFKPTGMLFTPIGLDLEEETAYGGEISEDNRPE